MSSTEVFSYALLLKGADRTTRILELTEEGHREEVKTALEAVAKTTPEAVRELWRERRRADELITTKGA